MHIEAIRLLEPGFILAFPLPGTSRVDTSPGVCTWGPGGSGHVDISGSVRMPGAGSGPAPAHLLPGGPDYLSVWTGRCDPRRKSGAPALDVKALSYYWRGGGEQRFLCARSAAPRASKWPKGYGALLSRGHPQSGHSGRLAVQPPRSSPWAGRARNLDAYRGDPGLESSPQ